MKNLHILATEKPSRLYYNNNDKCYQICKIEKESTPLKLNQNIYITNDEEIKEGDWVTAVGFCVDLRVINYYKQNTSSFGTYKKIILTTDQDLIQDDVQYIDDEFLEWFVKNPSCEWVEIKLIKQKSHLTLNDWVDEDKKFPISIAGAFCYRKIYKIIIPIEEDKKSFQEISKNCGKGAQYCEGQSQQCQCDKIWKSQYSKKEPEQDALNHFLSTSNVIVKDSQKFDYKNTVLPKELSKQETLEEAKRNYLNKCIKEVRYTGYCDEDFEQGAIWQKKISYSEEDLKYAFDSGRVRLTFDKERPFVFKNYEEFIEQFKKK